MFTVYDIDNEEYMKVEETDPSIGYTYADYLQWQFEESLAVFLLNENGRYDGATLYAGKDKTKCKALPGLIIDTKEIFTP